MGKRNASEYELVFGTNRILNCGSVVKIQGKGVNQEIIRLRIGSDGKLMVNCQVKDEYGNTIAKIHNNTFVHVNEAYEGISTENGLLVLHSETGEKYLDFEHLGGKKINVNGIFWVAGRKIIATDEGLKLNGITMKNNTFDSCGSAIALGNSGSDISLG